MHFGYFYEHLPFRLVFFLMNYSYSNTKMNQDQVTRINLSFESQNKHGNNERFLVSGSLLAKISILLCLLTSMFTMFANKISFLLWSLSSIHRGIVKMSTVNFDFIGELVHVNSLKNQHEMNVRQMCS